MNALSEPRIPDPNAPPPPLPPGWDVGDPLPADQNAFDGTVGKKEIQRLFAQIWSVSTIDSGFYSDIRRDGFTTDLDFYKVADPQSKGIDVSGESAAPPKIYSLNPSRCEDRDKCNAAEAGNITIGNRNGTRVDYNGDGIPDEPDIDQNGVTDPIIIAGGSYSAEAKFFAFADDNHMPIRRMMVDWDEEGLPPMNVDKRGLYKNRKPVCGTSNQGGLADVGICATMIPPTNGNNAPTFRTTGVTCSLDKPCSGNTFCMPASGAPSTFKVCEGINAGGDITYSSRACGEDRDCAGLPDFPTCSGSLPMSDLQSGVLGTEYKTMRFGNTPRACTTDYFTFVHQYSCGESNIGTRNAVYVRDLNTNNNPYKDGSFTAGIVSELKNKYRLRDDDYVCIFKPKVQAMDNWDWCNGSCKKEYNAAGDPIGNQTNGCYDLLSNGFVSAQQCSNTDDKKAQGIYPWSDYRGVIIVIPDIDR